MAQGTAGMMKEEFTEEKKCIVIRFFKNIVESVVQVFSGKGKKKKDNREKKVPVRKKGGKNGSGNGNAFTGNGRQNPAGKKNNGKNNAPAGKR